MQLIIHIHGQDYPYNFQSGIKHHNIWFTKALSTAEIEKASLMAPQMLDLAYQTVRS